MSIDFDELRRRLDVSLDRLKSNGDARDLERVLKERSRQLAARRLEAEQRSVLAEVIVARRAESLLAFPIRSVVEVREIMVTRLPHRTRHICGLFQLRGQVHCLVDVQPFIGASTDLGHQDRTPALLVQGSRGPLGIRVDEILGPRTLYVDELDHGRRERRLEFIAHVTRDCVEVLDVEALFAASPIHMTGTR